MSAVDRIVEPAQKALSINLDKNQYGTIAEIGAGQETARWFFRVGGAAGTIAKAISAYDMKVSDAIYGTSPRYVSRARLQQMLDYEYPLVIARLDDERGESATFFAFANTVAARSFSRESDGQGWLGIRFQSEPRSAPSQIDLHVTLHGASNLQDQETLGILGVNTVYGALNYHRDPNIFIASLTDGMSDGLLEVDMIDFSGPAFAQVDNRLMALRLVQRDLTPAAMFDADGEVIHVADALYDKAVLVERGRFRPPTKLSIEMLERAQAQLTAERPDIADDITVVSEMTLHNLMDEGDIDADDFLHRADTLGALGKQVLISNLGEYYRLASYLFRYTHKPVGVVMGLPGLTELFREKYYDDLAGGILEALGRLFKYDLRLYVCAALAENGSDIVNLDAYEPAPHLRHLYAYLKENKFVRALPGIRPELLAIESNDVLHKIRHSHPGWVDDVPDSVVRIIRERGYFGYVPTAGEAST